MSIRHIQFSLLGAAIAALLILVFALGANGSAFAQGEDNPTPPESPVKLIFIHHSTGENWLRDGYGNLGKTLGENNYFVSDTNYGWGRDGIGDRTDIVNWPEWFGAQRREDILNDLFSESEQHAEYTRTLSDPGGQNEIIMFKSCFPNSDLGGSPNDPPGGGYDMTVGGAKYIYNEILEYFATRPDKLFVVITAPPLSDPTHAANARAFNEWLVNDWLTNYQGNNVAVFDFYNILTGKNHHHRWQDGKIEHTYTPGANTLVYPSDDDHPSAAGSQKATAEFIPMLNIFYHRWKTGAPASPPSQSPAVATPEGQAESPQQPPAGEEEGVPPVAAPAGTVDDFENSDVPWYPSSGEGAHTAIQCDLDQTQFHGGAASLKINFTIDPGDWVDCGHSFDPPQSLAGSSGLMFWLHATQPGGAIVIILVSGEKNTPFENMITIAPESSSGWASYQIPWTAFSRASWAEEGGLSAVDPAHINGISISINSADTARQGTLWIDDILAAGASSEAAPPAAVQEPTPAKEQAATSPTVQKPPAEAEQPVVATAPVEKKPVSNRICPLPTIALPVGVVFVMLFRRRSAIIK